MQNGRTLGRTVLLLAFRACMLIPLGAGIRSPPRQGHDAVQLSARAGRPLHPGPSMQRPPAQPMELVPDRRCSGLHP